MSWQKYSDRARESKKVRAADPECVVLWWAAGNYCSEKETDGFLAKGDLEDAWRPIGRRFQHAAVAKRCVLAELFIDHGTHYEVNDYLEFNPSREQLDERRKKDAKRQAAFRARQKTLRKLGLVTRDTNGDETRDEGRDVTGDGPQGGPPVTGTVTRDVTDPSRMESRSSRAPTRVGAHDPVPSRPDPSRPVREKKESARATSSLLPDRDQLEIEQGEPVPADADRLRAHQLVRVRFEQRYHAAMGDPPSWTAKNVQNCHVLGAWLDKQTQTGAELEAKLARLLDAFFGDAWAIDNGYPIAALAGQPATYLNGSKRPKAGFTPPAAAAGFTGVEADLDRLYGPRKPARGGVANER